MKFSAEDLPEIVALLESADEFKPMVQLAVSTFCGFISELEEPVEKFRDFNIKCRLKSIKQITDAGYTVEEAIYITSDEKQKLVKAVNNAKSKK